MISNENVGNITVENYSEKIQAVIPIYRSFAGVGYLGDVVVLKKLKEYSKFKRQTYANQQKQQRIVQVLN